MELTNITELIRNNETCGLLRLCGADEQQIGANASDYAFFSALCQAVPQLTGHPFPHALAKALQNELGVTLSLSPNHCDRIWKACADRLYESRRCEPLTLAQSDEPEWTPLAWRVKGRHLVLDGSVLLQTKTCSWSAWDAEMRRVLDGFCRQGGSIVRLAPDAAACLEAPNLYRVEQALKEGKSAPVLAAQVLRFLASELQKRDMMLWIDTAPCGKDIQKLLSYAESRVGLPSLLWTGTDANVCRELWHWQSCAHGFEIRYAVCDGITDGALQEIARSYPVGRLWKLCEESHTEDTMTVLIDEACSDEL